MTTATELMNKGQDERDNCALNYMIHAFLRQWEPQDRGNRLDFEMQLHELIRATYREASKPYEKIMTSAVMNMPMPPVIIPKG